HRARRVARRRNRRRRIGDVHIAAIQSARNAGTSPRTLERTHPQLLVTAIARPPFPQESIVDHEAKKVVRSPPWSIEDSLDLYQVNKWGQGYFGINAAGHVVVRPDGSPEREIDLLEVVDRKSTRLNSSHVKSSYAV